MKKYKLNYSDKEEISIKLRIRYTTIDSYKVRSVDVYQRETANKGMITTVSFYYGFEEAILFVYSNDKLVSVTGTDVEMKFIEEMKDLLKELNK